MDVGALGWPHGRLRGPSGRERDRVSRTRMCSLPCDPIRGAAAPVKSRGGTLVVGGLRGAPYTLAQSPADPG